MKKISLYAVTLAALFTSVQAHALVESKPIAAEHRFHTVVYSPTQVVKYLGHYGYQSSILFEEGEEIKTISMGVSTAWMINPLGNRIFLKPLEQDALTNMLVITNKRVYNFELHAAETEDINDKDMIFEMKFIYDGTEKIGNGGIITASDTMDVVPLPDIAENPEKYNFKYTIAGPEVIAPIRIFDDGEFTFFEFRDKNADVPAFYTVDPRGEESIINYRTRGDYIVVERVSSRFTLRHGKDIVCVFNEARPLEGVAAGQYGQ